MTPTLPPAAISISQRYGLLSSEDHSLVNADFSGRVVLLRADLNVPVSKGKINDDTRIRALFPTLDVLLAKQAKVLLASHFGRPDPKSQNPAVMRDKFSLALVAGTEPGKEVCRSGSGLCERTCS